MRDAFLVSSPLHCWHSPKLPKHDIKLLNGRVTHSLEYAVSYAQPRFLGRALDFNSKAIGGYVRECVGVKRGRDFYSSSRCYFFQNFADSLLESIGRVICLVRADFVIQLFDSQIQYAFKLFRVDHERHSLTALAICHARTDGTALPTCLSVSRSLAAKR